jgi:acyl-CoA thioester hydrolase
MTKSEAHREAASGWFEGKSFVFPVRVYYEDTDLSGFVYHAGYLRFMERGRSEFLRAAGAGHKDILDASLPLVWVVHRLEIQFRRPARIEDSLLVTTEVQDVTPARMRLEQRVTREETLIAEAKVEVCVIALDGRPRRVPDAMRDTLASFLHQRELQTSKESQ